MENEIPHTILMTTDTVGGVWTYSMELCAVLEGNQINVHLATMGEALSESQQNEAAKLSNVTIHESDFDLEWMNEPWEDIMEAGKWLLDLEQNVQPDLIHLSNYCHGNLSWKNPVLVVGHSCVLSWWQAVKGGQAPDEWNKYKNRVKKGLQRADVVVGVSHTMMDSLTKLYGPFSQAEVIYNGRSSSQFYPKKKMPIIFSMGRIWDEAKNISALNQIADSLFWPVYAAGQTDKNISFDAQNMQLLGKISQSKAAECLARSSIYVMPARFEPFGLSILEAALSECALVLGDIPSLHEIWGDTALYADPNDPEELQKQIQELIKNPSQLRLKAREAKEHAQKYSSEIFGRKYIDLYQKILGLHKNKGSLTRQTKTKQLSA